VWVVLFGVFMALSSMTSLRGEGNFSVVEVGLVLTAIVGSATALYERGRAPGGAANLNLTHNPIVVFSALAGGVLIVSTGVHLNLYPIYFMDPARAILPFLTTIMCVIALGIVLATRATLVLRSYLAATVLVNVLYVAGYAIGFGEFFYGPRFTGLSVNPNQLALFSLCSTIIALMLLTKSRLPIWLTGAAAGSSIVIGLLTLSDAFTLAMVPILASIAYLGVHRFTRSFGATVVAGIFLTALCVAAVAYVKPDAYERAVDLVMVAMSSGNQDSVRELLWKNGFAAWAERPIIGNGAGAWSGVSAPFQATEAHNSFIDWLTMVGIVGSAPLALAFASILKLDFRRYIVSYLCLLSVCIFVLFHFVFRLPPVWLALMCVLALRFDPLHTVYPRWNMPGVSFRRAGP
jgi:O-antigen ligase